jgi:hypothetical protein
MTDAQTSIVIDMGTEIWSNRRLLGMMPGPLYQREQRPEWPTNLDIGVTSQWTELGIRAANDSSSTEIQQARRIFHTIENVDLYTLTHIFPGNSGHQSKASSSSCKYLSRVQTF